MNRVDILLVCCAITKHDRGSKQKKEKKERGRERISLILYLSNNAAFIVKKCDYLQVVHFQDSEYTCLCVCGKLPKIC